MKWVSSFSYLPVNYAVQLAEVEDQTQQILFDNNLNGGKIRLRFSNRHSNSAFHLKRVTVGIEQEGRIYHIRTITLNGNASISLAPGEEVWSDETELAVQAGDRLAVTSYVCERQSIESVCAFWSAIGPMVRLSRSGDYTDGSSFEEIASKEIYSVIAEDQNPVKAYFFYGVSGLQVLTDEEVKTVAMFGDSITHMSYVSNALIKRLYNAYPGKVTVLNRGIGGNRLLHDATKVAFLPAEGSCFGIAGVKRFEQNIFGEEHADAVLVLVGINDIMHPIQFDHLEEQITPEELQGGYQQLIEMAHRHGAKIFGATITPCGSDEYPADWLPRFEAIRIPVNERIRAGFGYDGFFDYDAAVRDVAKPGYMLFDCHIYDGLHPNDKGGALMAEQIDLVAIMN